MRTLLTTCALALVVTGCSADGQTRAVDPAAPGESSGSETLRPDADAAPEPVPDGLVSTGGLATVLDDGDGPELCLGPVAESYPPQCGGIALADFDFGDVGAEQAAGVTWGTYALTGTYDGTTFTVTRSIPAALYDTVVPPQGEPLAAACTDPEAPDPSRATSQDLDAVLNAASALPGYALAWLTDDTVNVAVTEDAAGAERTLRDSWGGPLCVTEVERSEAELNEVNTALQEALGEQLLTSGSYGPDTLDAQVVFDDGSIQEWADATYGEGVVQVESTMQPAA